MKNIIITSLVTIGILFGISMFSSQPQLLKGIEGDSYSYKAITSANASSTYATIVKGGSGVLGMITINTADARAIAIYDGNGHSTSSMTLIGSIKASTAEQTFIYNVAVRDGITLDVPASYVGSMTVSYK